MLSPWRPLWDQFGDFDFTAARSAAAHGVDFRATLPTSHLHNSSPFAPFLILIEDPEVGGRMVVITRKLAPKTAWTHEGHHI